MEVGGLECRPDHVLRRLEMAVGLAADRGAAAGRPDQAQQHPQRGGLSSSVRPQEAGDPPGFDGEAEVVDRRQGAEPLGQVPHLDARVLFRVIRHTCTPSDSHVDKPTTLTPGEQVDHWTINPVG